MDKESDRITIGALATNAGVNVETIRFYQRKRLLREPKRTQGSIRRYGDSDLARLRFIRSAQSLGFSLNEIGDLLRLEDGTSCREARIIGERKLAEVRGRLNELERIEQALAELVAKCSTARGATRCPLIVSIQEAPKQ